MDKLKCKYILFDLDGTLTESHPGITRSIKYALEKHNMESPSLEELKVFVGPPLGEKFMEVFGFTKEFADEMVSTYRDTPDHARKNKTAVINFVMESMGIENKDDVIMVGDTQYDVLGAAESGIKCIGVLYGYGQKDKLEEAGAYILAEKPSDIAEIF